MEVERRCMVCRTARPRSELVRFVRTQTGKIDIDLSLGMQGRGAYVCRNNSCMEEVFRKDRLARGLRAEADPEHAAPLRRRALEYLLSKDKWS